MSILFKFISIFLILFSLSAQGKRFKSPYVEFNVEYDWSCKDFGVNWICYHRLEKNAPPALIIITAKVETNSNNINQYIKIFKNNKINQRNPITKALINNHYWITGFSNNSIFENKISRYIVTICCENIPTQVHIFIGFHANQSNYHKYSNEFLKSIKSVMLSSTLKETSIGIKRQTSQQNQEMTSYLEKILYEEDLELSTNNQDIKKDRFKDSFFVVLFLIIIITIFFYLFYNKKRSKKTFQKRKTSLKKNLFKL